MVTFFGAGRAEAPTYDVRGIQIGNKKYSLAAYGQSMDLDLRLTPDVAARFRIEGLLFSGTDERGILVVGATAQFGFLVGVVAGKDLGKDMRLSFVADFGIDPQLSVLVANAVIRAIQNDEFSGADLFSKVERLRGAPGASFAWAPSPALGFVAEARYVWTRRVSADDSSRTANGVSLGGSAELDLEPLVHWPLAFQLVYRGDLPVGGDGIASVNHTGAGLYYTRRVRLALGLENVWRHGKIRPGVAPQLDSDSSITAIRFRYYW